MLDKEKNTAAITYESETHEKLKKICEVNHRSLRDQIRHLIVTEYNKLIKDGLIKKA